MPTIEPPDNNNEPMLPELGSFNTSQLTMEEQFMMNSYNRGIEKCGNIESLRDLALQMTKYYFHSQNLIKTLALDNLTHEMDPDKRMETVVRAKKIIKEAKDSLHPEAREELE